MTSPTWSDVLTALVRGRDLTVDETAWAMGEVMTGSASPAQLAGFLVALRAKGETVEELTALADTMLEHALRIEVPGRTVDLVGTGGDRAHTVNISTMAALVVAGTGTTVVKHGNRAASSSSGSADVLESLGIRLDHPAQRVGEIAREVGITFCFAQVFHPSMRHAGAVRRDLGIATTFNFLGPMINPGTPAATAVGVADLRMAPLMAGVFAARGTDALVFRGEDGLDELAPTARSHVWEVRDGVVTEHELDSVVELGLPPAQISDLRGADAAYNADVARRVLGGERGPVRDAVVLNAAAGLVADGSVSTATGSLAERLGAAMEVASRSIDDGAAADVLARWRSAAA